MTSFPTFFPKTFDDAVALIMETHFYISSFEAQDQMPLSADQRLIACYESMRITARLAQVTAWLMLQRAVNAGEVTAEDVSGPLYSLGGGALCREASGEVLPWLPTRLSSLLERSLTLYMRVARLDAQVRTAS